MLHIESNGATIRLSGRFDAAQERKALEVFDKASGDLVVEMADLEYISSMGLGILMKTYRRLHAAGHTITLRNLNKHIHDVFRYTSLDKLFNME